jgi:hypothetical protein
MTASAAAVPIRPLYRYNNPGAAILLYKGKLAGVADQPLSGSVSMKTKPRLRLEWRVKPAGAIVLRSNEFEIRLGSRLKSSAIRVWNRGWDDGWFNEATLGDDAASLSTARVHWFNMPGLRGAQAVSSNADGVIHRWEIELEGWQLRIDSRPDLHKAWTELHKADKYMITHVMDAARSDGLPFKPTDLESLLRALHMTFSFAIGCQVAPALPVGLDQSNRVVWKRWYVPHCDAARSIGPGWWSDRQMIDLADYLKASVQALMDPTSGERLNFQMMVAITSTTPVGFLEPRIMVAFAGIEHFTWHSLVVDQGVSKAAYKQLEGNQRLRKVLHAAQIPTQIDGSLTPALLAFAKAEGQKQSKVLDVADVVTQIRNRIVHPTTPESRVYHIDSLLAEAWAVARHLLTLLILHHLGYRGSYRDLSRISGDAHEVTQVPWS